MNNNIYAITEDKLQELIEFSVLTSDSLDMLQNLPLITGEPVAYILQNSKDSHKKLSWCESVDCENTPLYTHAQPLQPITADDVTNDMIVEYVETVVEHSGRRGIIVAAYNAVIKHRKGKT